MNNIEFIRISKIFISIIIISNYTNAQEWETPIIKGYGEVKYFDQLKSVLKQESSKEVALKVKRGGEINPQKFVQLRNFPNDAKFSSKTPKFSSNVRNCRQSRWTGP